MTQAKREWWCLRLNNWIFIYGCEFPKSSNGCYYWNCVVLKCNVCKKSSAMPLMSRFWTKNTFINLKQQKNLTRKSLRMGQSQKKYQERQRELSIYWLLDRYTTNCTPSRKHIQTINIKYSMINFIGLKFYLLVIP